MVNVNSFPRSSWSNNRRMSTIGVSPLAFGEGGVTGGPEILPVGMVRPEGK